MDLLLPVVLDEDDHHHAMASPPPVAIAADHHVSTSIFEIELAYGYGFRQFVDFVAKRFAKEILFVVSPASGLSALAYCSNAAVNFTVHKDDALFWNVDPHCVNLVTHHVIYIDIAELTDQLKTVSRKDSILRLSQTTLQDAASVIEIQIRTFSPPSSPSSPSSQTCTLRRHIDVTAAQRILQFISSADDIVVTSANVLITRLTHEIVQLKCTTPSNAVAATAATAIAAAIVMSEKNGFAFLPSPTSQQRGVTTAAVAAAAVTPVQFFGNGSGGGSGGGGSGGFRHIPLTQQQIAILSKFLAIASSESSGNCGTVKVIGGVTTVKFESQLGNHRMCMRLIFSSDFASSSSL